MRLKDLDIKCSYISLGEENIAKSFLVPALKCTKLYRRSVGFFSSSVLGTIIDGVVGLSRNGGKIQLIASPKLNDEDIKAIEVGYKNRAQIIEGAFTRDFMTEINELEDSKLALLISLIANSTLDIKIVVTSSSGMYHDKLGIMEDNYGDKVVFYGSPNSSLNGYQENYEKIRIVKSWEPSQQTSVDDECKEFDSLWDGTNPYVDVYGYKEAAKKNILEVLEKRKSGGKASQNSPIVLRDYQEEAISAWKQNGYKGFYVMATGTGKTWTAIYSAKRLIEEHPSMIVICAPYKHLVRQWCDDVEKVFPRAKIILVSSENAIWEKQLKEEIIRKTFNPDNQIIVISTIASFKLPRFMTALKTSKDEKLLIVDEAHRFNILDDSLKKLFSHMLGLSATPFSGSSAQRGFELMRWFGGQVFNLPIEVALDRGFLVPYNYYPIYVHATSDEEGRFNYHTQKILSCFKNNRCINPDLLVKSLRNRLRVISMAEEKLKGLRDIISKIPEKDHLIVYCGDGRLFDNSSSEELRHIQFVKRVLNEFNYKSSQFTATENMATRMQLVEDFNKQQITALAAIRCLDEGINIPSIKAALILSSNDDYREFVQRRGRILRTFGNKEYANIYDIIVLPSNELQAWAKIEFRRFLEYARLAQNWNELELDLNANLTTYDLCIEDIDVYDYEEMEVELDD